MARIYIGDDDTLLTDLLRFRLSQKGHEVLSTDDGEQLLDDIARQPPDLLLLDYQMPVRSAREIIEILKADPATAAIPILVLASEWREQDVMTALQLGITDYITKPFAPDELLFRIKRALSLRSF